MNREGRDLALEALMHQIAGTYGFRCDAYKVGCIRRRISARMRARAVPSFEAYGALLRRDPGESQRLLDTLTINVSRFYRNPETWQVLETQVLSGLWERIGRAPRCWSAGCAAGEEAYTLALLLLEQGRRTGARVGAVVDATDYDRHSLERAAQASFARASLKDLPADLQRRYLQGTDPVVVAPEVRRVVTFARGDLTCDPAPAPPYDLILCRNVLIYFDAPTQERIASRLADALAPGGYLVLGKVEAVRGEARRRLTLENPRERVYCRR